MSKSKKIDNKDNSQSIKAISALRKVFGKEIITSLIETDTIDFDSISTTIPDLDKALGGGIPKGRLVEIFGPESSGKTTLCLHLAAEAQKEGKVVFIDVEHAFDPVYAKNLGVNVEDIIFSQPSTAEEAFEVMEALASTSDVSLIILDSIGSLSPKAEVEGDAGDSNMGTMPKLLSQHARKMSTIAYRHNIPVVYINQIRARLGIVFGNPESTPGGHNFKHQASMRIEVRKIQTDPNAEKKWQKVRVRVVKNKLAPPFKEAIFKICFGTGVDPIASLVDELVLSDKGIITKDGAWYKYKEEIIGQGVKSVVDRLRTDVAFREKLEKELNDERNNSTR